MNKWQRFAGYLLYAVLMGYLVRLSEYYKLVLFEYTQKHYDGTPQFIYLSFYPILFGLLLALPHLLKQWFQSGKWRCDWIKLLAIGLPALYGATLPLSYFFLNWPGSTYWMAHGTDITLVSGIVLGYTLLATWAKQTAKKPES